MVAKPYTIPPACITDKVHFLSTHRHHGDLLPLPRGFTLVRYANYADCFEIPHEAERTGEEFRTANSELVDYS